MGTTLGTTLQGTPLQGTTLGTKYTVLDVKEASALCMVTEPAAEVRL